MSEDDMSEDGDGLEGLDDATRSIAENWELYFPFEPFQQDLGWVQAVKTFRRYLSDEGEGGRLLSGVDLERATQVVFDYAEFCNYAGNLPELVDFPSVMKNNSATMALKCLGLAICSMRPQQIKNDGLGPFANRITARFVNFRPVTMIRQLKSTHLGRFVAVRGNVLRVSGVRPLVQRMDYSCAKCGEMITKNSVDGKFQPPTYCENSDCKGRTFKPIKPSAVTVDYQKIRLQEIDESNSSSGGSVPRSIDIELTEELVDLVVPGDVITVTGIVKALNSESLEGRGSRAKGKNKESSLLILILEANAIESKSKLRNKKRNNKSNNIVALEDKEETGQAPEPAASQRSQDSAIVLLQQTQEERDQKKSAVSLDCKSDQVGEKNDVVVNLTERDYKMIYKVANQFDFSFLVYSLCPLILGHEHVKAGLLLGLAGGTTTQIGGNSESLPIRADIHVLVVGDPGLGKSQMLKAASAVSPRSVYVCGNTATKSGLTVTMTKDKVGEHVLEAGALVLADRGVCCIDEFDKMACEQAALLEAMEQQSISIAKAGIVCTLSARTAILASANPIGGRYNRNKTILENLRMSGPLLSRFDLVFILVDDPNEATDDLIADYVVDIHLKRKKRRKKDFQGPSVAEDLELDPNMSLKQRLKAKVATYKDPLPPEMLRKYIAYAKHYCRPKLSLQACQELQSFYLELRQQGNQCDSTPITTRQLESLIRLAQARAKLELRDTVTAQDAKDIVSLMRESLLDAYTDEAGTIDFQRSNGMSMTKICKAMVAQLKKASQKHDTTVFTMEQIKLEAKNINILHQIPDFNELIEVLNQQCYLLKRGGGKYKLLAGEF